jgi:hypothetical protein
MRMVLSLNVINSRSWKIMLALPESGSLPSARRFAECFLPALGKVPLSITTTFTESRTLGTEIHSAKKSLPNAKHSVNAALDKGPSAVVYS